MKAQFRLSVAEGLRRIAPVDKGCARCGRMNQPLTEVDPGVGGKWKVCEGCRAALEMRRQMIGPRP